MTNVLDVGDQYVFLGERVFGVNHLLQCIWIYDRGVNVDALRQFHRHLQHGRLSRNIERSPLPFGRHRWVSSDRLADIDMVAAARPRSEFDGWLNEHAQTPLDAEHGPGWHLAVLPFTDGGAGVSLVVLHCLIDGVGLSAAMADAVAGQRDPISWPAAGSRRRWRAVREDARQTVLDIPAVGRALVAATRFAPLGGAATEPLAPPPPDEQLTVAMATIFVDADEWDARAESLGGTSNTLLAGFAARLARRVGRIAADGSVSLAMPVNERAPGDTRANAVWNIPVTVDPAATDLHEIRAAIKQALIRHQDVPDERRALLPLIPLTPERLMRRTVSAAGADTTSVVSSNLGPVTPGAGRPDGTDADYFAMRNIYPDATDASLRRLGGVLLLLSGVAVGRRFVSVTAYHPPYPGSNDALRRDLSGALDDFSLAATTGWPQ